MSLRPESWQAAKQQRRSNLAKRAARAATAGERGYAPPVKLKTREAGWPEPVYNPALTIFQNRNALLRWLGFSSYKKYLASDDFKLIKNRVWFRDGGECVKCHRPATQIRHLSYSLAVLTGEDITDAVCSCRDCHVPDHFDERGNFKGLNKRKELQHEEA